MTINPYEAPLDVVEPVEATDAPGPRRWFRWRIIPTTAGVFWGALYLLFTFAGALRFAEGVLASLRGEVFFDKTPLWLTAVLTALAAAIATGALLAAKWFHSGRWKPAIAATCLSVVCYFAIEWALKLS